MMIYIVEEEYRTFSDHCLFSTLEYAQAYKANQEIKKQANITANKGKLFPNIFEWPDCYNIREYELDSGEMV